MINMAQTNGGLPDVHYAFAPIRGDSRYRIIGQRGDEAYLSFTLHRGERGSGFENYFDSHINHHALTTDEQGRFEIPKDFDAPLPKKLLGLFYK